MTIGELISILMAAGAIIGAIVNLYVKLNSKPSKYELLQVQLDLAAIKALETSRDDRLDRIERKLDELMDYERKKK